LCFHGKPTPKTSAPKSCTPSDIHPLQASLARKSLKETARNHAEESWRKLEGTKQVEDFRCLWRRVEGAYKSKEKSNDQLVLTHAYLQVSMSELLARRPPSPCHCRL
jgi:hypothetical protein